MTGHAPCAGADSELGRSETSRMFPRSFDLRRTCQPGTSVLSVCPSVIDLKLTDGQSTMSCFYFSLYI